MAVVFINISTTTFTLLPHVVVPLLLAQCGGGGGGGGGGCMWRWYYTFF